MAPETLRSPVWEPVFVMGCPRSGTTWVQLLLDEHPAVSTAPETQIFPFYLKRFREQWLHEARSAGRGEQGRAGLSRLLTESEFQYLCRSVAQQVLEQVLHAAPPDTPVRYVVEKSPQNAEVAGWIHELFPSARFVHVVRDPRDTVASLLRAARGWGDTWAPRNPIDAARMWCRHVDGAAALKATNARYFELRYEDLYEDTVGVFSSLLTWLELEGNEEFRRAAVEACSVDQLRKADGKSAPLPGERSPKDFFGTARTGGWRESMSAGAARLVEAACGERMESFGYSHHFKPRATTRARLVAHDGIQRLRDAVDWKLQQALFRI